MKEGPALCKNQGHAKHCAIRLRRFEGAPKGHHYNLIVKTILRMTTVWRTHSLHDSEHWLQITRDVTNQVVKIQHLVHQWLFSAYKSSWRLLRPSECLSHHLVAHEASLEMYSFAWETIQSRLPQKSLHFPVQESLFTDVSCAIHVSRAATWAAPTITNFHTFWSASCLVDQECPL